MYVTSIPTTPQIAAMMNVHLNGAGYSSGISIVISPHFSPLSKVVLNGSEYLCTYSGAGLTDRC